jgi:hypothetical protein
VPRNGSATLPSGRLRAWITSQGFDESLVCFVAVPADTGPGSAHVTRPPAVQPCASVEDARTWMEHQAASLGLPIEWVND